MNIQFAMLAYIVIQIVHEYMPVISTDVKLWVALTRQLQVGKN